MSSSNFGSVSWPGAVLTTNPSINAVRRSKGLRIEFRREGLNFLCSDARATKAEGLPHHKIFEVSFRYRFFVLGHLALWERDKLGFDGHGRKAL